MPDSAALFTPTPEQILAAEQVLEQCAWGEGMPPNEPRIYAGAIWPLAQYCRQYLGYRPQTGETVILINCFHMREKPHFPDWQRRIVDVDDGGKNYFHVSIDLANRRCFHFVRNSIGG